MNVWFQHFIVIATIFSLIMLAACSSKPHALSFKNNNVKLNETTIAIYVVNHGWHTGFVVPAKKIQKNRPNLKKRFAAAHYIEFGWGDSGFYQANEITLELILRALLWPTESVVHAVEVPNTVFDYFKSSDVAKLCLNEAQYSSLIKFISNSFYKNENNKSVPLGKGIYGNSQFYQAEGDYYLFNTCNKWTAKGLKSIGMDISPVFKLTADSIMTFIKQKNQNKINQDKTINANTTICSYSENYFS